MKKGLIIVAALGLLAVVSCKKDHTCNCTFTSSGGAFGDLSISADTVYTDMKKKDAITACDLNDASYNDGSENTTVECELK
jgi:hypothetical protein